MTRWRLSPSFDALTRDLERPLTASEAKTMAWQDVEAEAPGFVVINRYRASPHPRVTFANDFYSDEVRVFLNGRILYRGRSAQDFRDPGFLGIVSADTDALYLPLRKGRNELVLAVSERGGGWRFVCRLEPLTR